MTKRGTRFAVLLAAGAAVAGCASTPPEKDPVQIKLNDLDTRLTRIERVVSNQSLLELSNQLDSLQGQVRALRNDVDQLSNNLAASRKEQRDLYTDLDQRVKGLEGRGGAAVPATPPAAPMAAAAAPPEPRDGMAAPGAADGNDRTAYQAAFALLKDSQYDKSIAAFQQFLGSYPDSALADNAQYWLGEAYYVNKAYAEALAAFQRVIDKYPQSRKQPDALLKIGYCRYELKQWDEARHILSRVASSYPDTAAGRLAQQRLDQMTEEKH